MMLAAATLYATFAFFGASFLVMPQQFLAIVVLLGALALAAGVRR